MNAFSFKIFFILFFLFTASCADKNSPENLPTNSELSRMTPEERQAKAPNSAFEAIYDRSLAAVEQILEDNPSLFIPKNEEGRTPLMVAITLREEEISIRIARELSIEDLKAMDNDGRGYISYAAEHGNLSLIELIAEKYKASLRFGLARFHNIDFTDNNERHALFYAANASVAKLLKDYWMQWTLTWSTSWTFLSGFYQQKDITDQNVLHTAAIDNRYDFLQWAIEQVCGSPYLEDSDFLFGVPRLLGQGLDIAAGALQRAPLIPDDLVNEANLEGNTPLHLAVRNGHLQASQVLMSCRFVNYRQSNNFGRNPLSELLANLDRNQSNISIQYKNIFDSLLEQRNYISLSRNFKKRMIDDTDLNDFSSLHYAARLRDPYFYIKMKNIGDVHLVNSNGDTPRGLFLSTQGSMENE